MERAHRDPGRQQEQFRADVKARLSYGVEADRLERLRDAVAVGSAVFGRRIRGVAAGKSLRGIAGKAALRRRLTWAEVRGAVEQVKSEEWSRFVDRRGDDGRDLFLWAARRCCGLTLRELGSVVGAEFAAVSATLKRFERRAVTDKNIRAKQATLMSMLNVEP